VNVRGYDATAVDFSTCPPNKYNRNVIGTVLERHQNKRLQLLQVPQAE
jgi:hypothetical protein